MTRLAKYLKPFLPMILVAVVLLFVQAMADLSLPDFMGRIVNVGIQQSGIDSAVPAAIRQSEMNRVFLFLSADNKARVLGDYTLVTKDSPEYASDVKQYPALANEPVYVLKPVNGTELDQLNPVMGKALLVVYGIEQVMADPSKAAAFGQTGTANPLSLLPEGTDIFAALQNPLLSPLLTPMLSGMNKKFDVMGNSLIVQSAAPAVDAEYAALGMDTSSLQNHYILSTGFIMLLLSLLSVACTVSVGFLSAKVAAGTARNLRKDVFKKVESFSNVEFDRFSVSSLITRTTNDITQLQMLIILMVRMVIYAPILGVGGVIKALSTDASMWWIIALAVVALLGLIIALFSTSLPKFRIMQSLIDRLNRVTRENLAGMMVVRAFNAQSFEETRFDKANQDLMNTQLFVNRVMVLMMPMMMIIMNGVTLLVVWVGAHEVAQSSLQVGSMIAFMQYAMQVVMGFLMLSMMFIFLPRASVSADRIADVLETRLSIEDPDKPRHFEQPVSGTVEFRHVSFHYPGAEDDVLHDLSFVAEPGQTTAFIGSTGSGKSTVVNLIPRFYDVTGGAILIDGVDVRDVTQHDLRAQMGYIPQKAMLFSGSIDSNLRYADENAPDEVIREAADIAQASNFIAEKPDGLATEIAQEGTNVSGGQRQRLSIARALVKRAPIYIFDDSFSALDFKTDSALRRALKEKTGSSTILIVTQRVSTIRNAEQIIVLDEGKIVGKGTHHELMDQCEVYREIALSQLGVEELA